jgi:hypothetical protein
MKKLIKKKNRLFIPFNCTVCLDLFLPGGEINEFEDGSVVCYQCAEQDDSEIRERINKKIDCLKENIRRYLT